MNADQPRNHTENTESKTRMWSRNKTEKYGLSEGPETISFTLCCFDHAVTSVWFRGQCVAGFGFICLHLRLNDWGV